MDMQLFLIAGVAVILVYANLLVRNCSGHLLSDAYAGIGKGLPSRVSRMALRMPMPLRLAVSITDLTPA